MKIDILQKYNMNISAKKEKGLNYHMSPIKNTPQMFI